MTCREKLKMERPEDVNCDFGGGCYGCPDHYGYMDKPDYCMNSDTTRDCTKCWDREIPGTEKIGKPLDKVTIVARDVNGKREVYEFDSWDAVDVTGKDESEQILLILVGDVCIYSGIAHTWITWEVVRGFFA